MSLTLSYRNVIDEIVGRRRPSDVEAIIDEALLKTNMSALLLFDPKLRFVDRVFVANYRYEAQRGSHREPYLAYISATGKYAARTANRFESEVWCELTYGERARIAELFDGAPSGKLPANLRRGEVRFDWIQEEAYLEITAPTPAGRGSASFESSCRALDGLLSELWEKVASMSKQVSVDQPMDGQQSEAGLSFDRMAVTSTELADSLTPATVSSLRSDLLALAGMKPQPRGYAFEKFLKLLFDAYGLEARGSFKLEGEQIDGSFQLSHETFLLEAKWQERLCGAKDLRAFHGKIEQTSAWARGLFISYSGFSPEGLLAFGRGKRLVCMDGSDLHETLNRHLSLREVLEGKVRRAAETGVHCCRVRDLFPLSELAPHGSMTQRKGNE